MNRDYTLASPSLTGILSHDSVTYNGVKRTAELRAIFDRPRGLGYADLDDPKKRDAVERYLSDLYTVFIKRLTNFAMEPADQNNDGVALMAMLQEFIKVKKMLADTTGKKI